MLLLASTAAAAVAPTTLAELSKRADQIVLGRVTQVHMVTDRRVAEVEVLRVIKGRVDLSHFFLLAEPTWTCDISDARKDETALFFLASGDELKASRAFWRALDRVRQGAPFYEIEWSGRGRMPLRKVDGTDYATLWTRDVRLPDDVATIAGPEPKYASFIRSVLLDDLLPLIERTVAEAGQ